MVHLLWVFFPSATTQLLKKDIPYLWSKECEISFQKLITILTKNLLLKDPNFDNHFFLIQMPLILQLAQKDELSETLLPIFYASRTLNKAEINYSTIEKE